MDEPRIATLEGKSLVDDEGQVTVAFLKYGKNGWGFTLGLFWLPDFVAGEMNDQVREAVVSLLRLHAQKIESREMDAKIAHVKDINNVDKRGQA